MACKKNELEVGDEQKTMKEGFSDTELEPEKNARPRDEVRSSGGRRFVPSLLKDGILLVMLVAFSLAISIYFCGEEENVEAKIFQAESSGTFSKKVANFSATEMPGMVMTIPSGRMVPHPPMTLEKFIQYHEWGGGLVIDVRTRSDYNKAHIPGALALPSKDFEASYERHADQLEGHRKNLIVVYCGSRYCGLAEGVQDYLIRYGFEHVGVFVDGLNGWKNAGMKTENGLQ